MRKHVIFSVLAVVFLFNSCELLEETTNGDELTKDNVIEGLKKALEIGTDTATNVLGLKDGYYGNQLVKILLPEEVQTVQSTINSVLNVAPSLSSYLNLDTHFENVVKSINRAVESAASEAGPVFKNAITGMSLTEAWDILNGTNPLNENQSEEFDSTSATNYFKMTTTPHLISIYGLKIDNALDVDLGLGFSANQAWNTLRNTYNGAVSTITGNFITNSVLQLTGYSLNPIETESIGEHCTEKALDGLFLKVGNEEKKIRKNPFQWAVDIIQKVFGSIFKESGD